LNCRGRAGLFTKPTINAAGKIDAKPGGITTPVCSLGRLHGDAAYRTNRRAQIAGHAPFTTIGVPGQDNHCSRTGRQRALVLRVFLGDRLTKKMYESCGEPRCQRLYCFPGRFHNLVSFFSKVSSFEFRVVEPTTQNLQPSTARQKFLTSSATI